MIMKKTLLLIVVLTALSLASDASAGAERYMQTSAALGVVPVALMSCCGTSCEACSTSVVAVANEVAAGKPLVVFKPTAKAEVKFVSHKQRGFAAAPSIGDSAIALNVAAAFTLDVETMDVCGDHVVGGERIAGYDDVTATGHLLIVGNKASIKGNSQLDESLKAAQEGGGYLFQQCYIVEDGRGKVERIPQAILDRNPCILYRAVCIMGDGSLAVVQGGEPMFCHEFVNALVALGARQALYLDMGTWAWGWVREKGKPVQELAEHFNNTRYQSNWLQFIAK